MQKPKMLLAGLAISGLAVAADQLLPAKSADRPELKAYASQVLKDHIKSKHDCAETTIVEVKVERKEDNALRERWVARHCGKISDHILIFVPDGQGGVMVATGELKDGVRDDK